MELVGTYTTDLNLIDLNAAMIGHIQTTHKTKLVKINQRLRELLAIIDSQKDAQALDEYGKLYADGKSLSNPLTEYLTVIKPIVDRYQALPKIKFVKIFGSDLKVTSNQSEDDKKTRLVLIAEFLLTASKYAPVSYQMIQQDINVCSSCGTNLKIGDSNCSSCDLVLDYEVVPNVVTPEKYNDADKVKTHLSNINRAISSLTLSSEHKIDISEILTKLDLTALPARTPGKYIYFKLCQS